MAGSGLEDGPCPPVADEVDHPGSPRQARAAVPGAPIQVVRDERRVHAERARLRVHQDRDRALVQDRACGRDEGERRDEDLVAGLDVENAERQMMAAVPLAQATAWRAPTASAKARSNLPTNGPTDETKLVATHSAR
ncbi:MAG: hypothetical protein U0838_17650 [Chloroflexota bacterium]